MSNIETVIKNCENWINNHKGENYLLTYSSVVELLALLKEQEAAYQGAVELLWQKTILFDDAIKRLKEQETNPMEPIEEIANDVLLWHCGKCGFYLGPNDHFCSNCGRAVKWK